MTHALRMGREYTEPFQGFGKGDKHEISSLCEYTPPLLAGPLNPSALDASHEMHP